MMNCLVIDDEPLARKGLLNYIDEMPFLSSQGTGTNAIDLTLLLESNDVDLVFLDIQMPKMNGIEYLKTVKNPPLTIITTAYPNYALESFEYDVIDYLLKPITFERFFQASKKAYDYMKLMKSAEKSKDYFFIKCAGKYEKIVKEEILYIQGMQNYVTIVTEKGKFTTLMYIKDMAAQLGKPDFIRTHKSYLVAKSKVSQIAGSQIKIGEFTIPISRHYREEVLSEVVGDDLWKR